MVLCGGMMVSKFLQGFLNKICIAESYASHKDGFGFILRWFSQKMSSFWITVVDTFLFLDTDCKVIFKANKFIHDPPFLLVILSGKI